MSPLEQSNSGLVPALEGSVLFSSDGPSSMDLKDSLGYKVSFNYNMLYVSLITSYNMQFVVGTDISHYQYEICDTLLKTQIPEYCI